MRNHESCILLDVGTLFRFEWDRELELLALSLLAAVGLSVYLEKTRFLGGDCENVRFGRLMCVSECWKPVSESWKRVS